ncbi:transcriptional regulator [Gammaproteobacteria bacterium]|nr:transcriptional regulator [Gammaproteobacteria bacterium]
MLKSLDNALSLLRFFDLSHHAWGVRELALAANMSSSSVQRILATLAAHQFLSKDAQTHKYHLGIRCLELGNIVQQQVGFRDVIRPFMQDLNNLTDETVFLYWHDGESAICIDILESTQALKFSTHIGSKIPIGSITFALPLLAFQPAEVTAKYAPKNKIQSKNYFKAVAQINKTGCAYSSGEYLEGVHGLSVPLLNSQGIAQGLLCIAGPINRFSKEEYLVFKPQMQAIAQKIMSLIKPYLECILR